MGRTGGMIVTRKMYLNVHLTIDLSYKSAFVIYMIEQIVMFLYTDLKIRIPVLTLKIVHQQN